MALLNLDIERPATSMIGVTAKSKPIPWWCLIPLASVIFPKKCSGWELEHTDMGETKVSPAAWVLGAIVAVVVIGFILSKFVK